MTRDPNPQAFPMPASEHSQGGHHEQNGMDLRDWFATTSLRKQPLFPANLWQALRWAVGLEYKPSGFDPEHEAQQAYAQADAMLAERAKGGER